MNKLKRRTIDFGPAPIVISTRFSVLLADSKAWRTQRGASEESHRAYLLNEDRLHSRLAIFERITLASMRAQIPAVDPTNLRHVVFTSKDVPDSVRRELTRIERATPWLKVVYLSHTQKRIPHQKYVREFLEEIGRTGQPHAHTRIDDDDAFSVDFVAKLREYVLPHFVGFAVSFASGLRGDIAAGGAVSQIHNSYWPKGSIGLAYVHASEAANVHALGNHLYVDTKVPLIMDAIRPMVFRGLHGDNDSGVEKYKKIDLTDIEVVKMRFPFLVG